MYPVSDGLAAAAGRIGVRLLGPRWFSGSRNLEHDATLRSVKAENGRSPNQTRGCETAGTLMKISDLVAKQGA